MPKWAKNVILAAAGYNLHLLQAGLAWLLAPLFGLLMSPFGTGAQPAPHRFGLTSV
jgi:hypothetical protein